MKRQLSAVPVFLLAALSVSVHAQVAGYATVTDGDTLTVDGQRVRLFGINAPESRQVCAGAAGRRWRCGQSATAALAKRVGGRLVVCTERDRDRYGRVVAVCRAGGEDLNAWMVSQGLALAYRRYSMAYVGQERAAKAARRGLWRGEFVAPWYWRKGKRLSSAPAVAPAAQAGECRIKGNISRSGTRIYHVPGGGHYARTRISASKGERWFCSEAEARVAGWRRSGR